MEDRENCMVDIGFEFAEISHDHVQITKEDGTFTKPDMTKKDPNDFWLSGEEIDFAIAYDEVEDFIEELKHQLEVVHHASCSLTIN